MSGSELAQLSAAQQALAEVETPAEAKELYDKLEALSQYARRYRLDQDAQNEIAVTKLRAARRGGELLAETVEAHRPAKLSQGARVTTLPDGFSWSMSSRWQAIRPELLPDEKFDDHAQAVMKAGEDLTLSGVLSLARKGAGGSDTPPLPEGQWRTVVADPPWPYEANPVRPDESGPRAAGATKLGAVQFPYQTMSVEDIAALKIDEHVVADAHLYLWTTNRFLEAAYDIARSWGFAPSTLLVWCKRPMGHGLGGAFTITTEFVLFARRGTLEATDHVDTTWLDRKSVV